MTPQQALHEPFRALAEQNPHLWLGPPGAVITHAIQTEREEQVLIGGVPLPNHVIAELRKLGIPLAFYNKGELQDAVNACAVDCTLVDDDEGVTFQDKLVLNDNERAQRSVFGEIDRHRVTSVKNFGVISFAGRIAAERGGGGITSLPSDM